MFLKKTLRIRHTLASRLTLWYATIFTMSSFGAFLIFYLIISSVIQTRSDQNLLKEFEEFSSLLALKGMDEIKTAIVLESEAEGVDKMFFRILDMNGEVTDTSNMSSWGKIGINKTALKQLTYGTTHVFETLVQPEHKHKVRILYAMIGPGMTLQIGQSLVDDAHFLAAFREIFSTTIVVLMVFSALVGWVMARRALSGVEEVTRTALDISKGAFERRVQVKSKGDEIERLAMVFNRMLDRINGLIIGMKEVTDNIAHDLKSPITRIRGLAELKLNQGKSNEGCEDLAADTIEECDQLLQMINTMLEISETEAGVAEFAKEEVDVAKVIRDACELFHPIATNKGVHLISKVPDSAFLCGDIHSFQRMIVNLLENAIKYTPPEGGVKISLKEDKGQIFISIHDTGIGICQDDLPHIFERLYRCDRSRSQIGFGLGLSLAKAIAQAHGGNITVSSQLGSGSTFKVILPKFPVSP